jgi:hypothetical protein
VISSKGSPKTMADRVLHRRINRRTLLKATAGISIVGLPEGSFRRAFAFDDPETDSPTGLPLVLLGPILRRVEPTAVSVFIATSQPSTIGLSVYKGVVDPAALPTATASGAQDTMRFGAQFHATVVTAKPADTDALLPGQRYSYDIVVTREGDEARSLLDLKLLETLSLCGYGSQDPASEHVEVLPLGYGGGKLPSFVTCPETLDALVLAHGSCRKPHGAGKPALWHLDAYMEKLNGVDAGWPHMLFLTGDQIYADDVATALLPGITSLGIELLSDTGNADVVESVPRPLSTEGNGGGGAGDLAIRDAVLPAGFRQKLTAVAGLTSAEAESHLIGFGEYLAMYCVAWNPLLWPTLAVAEISPPDPANPNDLDDARTKLIAELGKDAAQSMPPNPAAAEECSSSPLVQESPPKVLGPPATNAPQDLLTPLYGDSQSAKSRLIGAGDRFLREKARLDEYRREVARIRRLLAHVPTYMVADDHEITDDWFMNGKIRDETRNDPFGRALLRNGMAAYAICQAWGDDPGAWADGDRRDTIRAISDMFGEQWQGGAPNATATQIVETKFGLLAADAAFDFSFSIAGPMHQVRVLDTRTRRGYETPTANPALLTPEALDSQVPQQDLPEGQVLIVVSPAPIFGPPVISEIGGAIKASIHDLTAATLSDAKRAQKVKETGFPEGEVTGKEAFDAEHWGANPESFERLLERLSHFPRVVVLAGDVHYGAAYEMDWTGDGRTSRIVHFTASGSRNEWTGGGPGLVRNLMLFNGMSLGLQKIGLPMTRFGWKVDLPPVVEDLDAEPVLTRLAIQTTPVLLSNELFRAPHQLVRPPDWAWRAMPIVDVRLSEDRPPGARVTYPEIDLPEGASALERYGEAVGHHVDALDRVAVARGLQFLNNVGIVRFATSGDELRVEQSLYSLRPRSDPNELGAAYIVHAASLQTEPIALPTAIGPEA